MRWSDAYLQAAIDLYDAGNCSEAATLILAGPEQVRFLVEAAKQVVIWKMPELGLELGRRIMTRWPNDPNGPFRVAGMLRELGRAEEAEVVLRDAPERWRNEPDILSIWASLPMHWHDWNQALERWTMLIERFPDLGKFPAMKARCLRIAGRIEEAEGVLRRAEVDFPADEDCRIVRAELEMAMSR